MTYNDFSANTGSTPEPEETALFELQNALNFARFFNQKQIKYDGYSFFG